MSKSLFSVQIPLHKLDLCAEKLFVFSNPNFSGWWLTYPSEKYDFVSWDYDIPNIWKVIQNSMVPNHQPVLFGKNPTNLLATTHLELPP